MPAEPVEARESTADLLLRSKLFPSVLGVDEPVLVGDFKEPSFFVGDFFSSFVTASLIDRNPVIFAFAELNMLILILGLALSDGTPEAALSLEASLASSAILVGLAAIAPSD